jgi:hypothetical protein
MGQQQLLLLVLGIVIVGLAVVVGIQAFGENQKKANADALVNDGVRIASDAQAWALKPQAFGGGNGQFNGLTLEQLGYTVTGSTYSNLNGQFTIAVTNGTAPATGSVVITGCSPTQSNTVVVTVNGTGPSNISTAVTNAPCAS